MGSKICCVGYLRVTFLRKLHPETHHGDAVPLRACFPSPLGEKQAPSCFVMQARIEAEEKYEVQKSAKLLKQS
jgi:hypothetical protein